MTDDLPLRVLFMMPSCVPATPFEHSGAKLVAEDMEQFLRKSRILGLGEVMDYVSATSGTQEMLDKLRLFDGKPIDGHAPLISGRTLNAYRVAGPSTDHECSNFDEVKESLLARGKMKLTVAEYNEIERQLRQKLETQFNTPENAQEADDIALKMVKELYEKVVKAIDQRYHVVVSFK